MPLFLIIVQRLFMRVLLLPAVDTHYLNTVKIEIVLAQTETPQITFCSPFSALISDYATLQRAFSVRSHRKQRT